MNGRRKEGPLWGFGREEGRRDERRKEGGREWKKGGMNMTRIIVIVCA